MGSVNEDIEIGTLFPGYQRKDIKRDLTQEEVIGDIILSPEELKRFSSMGEIITDNNQLLAYGKASYLYRKGIDYTYPTFDLINQSLGYEKLTGYKSDPGLSD